MQEIFDSQLKSSTPVKSTNSSANTDALSSNTFDTQYYESYDDEKFALEVLEQYLSDVFRDISIRNTLEDSTPSGSSNNRAKIIDKVAFYDFFRLPGMLNDRLHFLASDQDSKVTHQAFSNFFKLIYTGSLKQKLYLTFKMYYQLLQFRFDFDNDGKVSEEDLQTVLNFIPHKPNSDQELKEELPNKFQISNQDNLITSGSTGVPVKAKNARIRPFKVSHFLLQRRAIPNKQELLSPSKIANNRKVLSLCNSLFSNAESLITYSEYESYQLKVSIQVHDAVLDGIRSLVPFNSVILRLRNQFCQNVLQIKENYKKNNNIQAPCSPFSHCHESRKRQISMRLQRKRLADQKSDMSLTKEAVSCQGSPIRRVKIQAIQQIQSEQESVMLSQVEDKLSISGANQKLIFLEDIDNNVPSTTKNKGQSGFLKSNKVENFEEQKIPISEVKQQPKLYKHDNVSTTSHSTTGQQTLPNSPPQLTYFLQTPLQAIQGYTTSKDSKMQAYYRTPHQIDKALGEIFTYKELLGAMDGSPKKIPSNCARRRQGSMALNYKESEENHYQDIPNKKRSREVSDFSSFIDSQKDTSVQYSSDDQFESVCYLKTQSDILKEYYVVLIQNELYIYKSREDKVHKKMHMLQHTFVSKLEWLDSFVERKGKTNPSSLRTYPVKINISSGNTRVLYFPSEEQQNIWAKELIKASGTRYFSELYTLGEKLGEGQYGITRLATCNRTGDTVAVKIIKKEGLQPIDVYQTRKEIEVMKVCQHPNVLKLIDEIESPDHYYLVLEYCQGGDLYDYFEKYNFVLNETRIKQIIEQIASALAYLQSFKIVHRDIKAENILMTDNSKASIPKICDFGFCTFALPKRPLSQPFGSLQYMAPEVLLGKPYYFSGDVWSLGCLLHFLLSSFLPFDDDAPKKIKKKIFEEEPTMQGQHWKGVSSEAKHVVRCLLQKQINKRMSVQELMESEWLSKK